MFFPFIEILMLMCDQDPFIGEGRVDTSTVELGVTPSFFGGWDLEADGYEVTVLLPAGRKRRWSFRFAGESLLKFEVLIALNSLDFKKGSLSLAPIYVNLNKNKHHG